MKGQSFTTPEGKTVKVLDFDPINKMAYINVYAGNFTWIHEKEYCNWVINDTAQMPKFYIPDIPAQMTDEQIKSQKKIIDDAVQIQTTNAVDVCEQTTDGEGVGNGNTEPEVIAEKSEVKSKEKAVKAVKAKTTKTKK